MLMHPLPTVKKAYSFLCEEEKQRGLAETKSSDLIHAMSIHTYDNSKESQPVASRQQKQWSSTHSKPQGNRKPLHCSYCEGTTHTVDRCFFLNGFLLDTNRMAKMFTTQSREKPLLTKLIRSHLDSHKPLTDPTLQFTPRGTCSNQSLF
ncbi:hypothetical protein Patl1_13074 [Pistacia atlantica]|uniref:Uncharacterized protein n=1 Tax=Pistacia atlantica TaxID=434234 RepID=A0ACC1AV19_9ROSI|nr:hypothetical protein Patl1_13074 [Pistacia atlantica]